MTKTKTVKISYPALVQSTFNEGAFKARLKKLNPILGHLKECSEVREFIIAELKSSISDSTTGLLGGINNSLSLFKTALEFHAPAIRTVPQTANGSSDLFFQYVLQPILPEILSYWNYHILAYCHLAAEGLKTVADSPATANQQLIYLIHKATRILLSLLKPIAGTGEQFGLPKYHLQLLEASLESLINVNLELPLDVKCNLALGICYVFKILKKRLQDNEFLATAFSASSFIGDTPVNQLALAFSLLTIYSTQDPTFQNFMVRSGQFLFSVDHGSKEALNLGTGRVLELWMEKLVQSDLISAAAKNVFKNEIIALFPDIEFFVFSYLPGHIDAVKSCCRHIVRNLTKIYERMEPPDVLTAIKEFAERILAKPDHIKWIALLCLTETTKKSLAILDLDEYLPQTLLSCERTMKNPASEVYLTLMRYNFPEIDIPTWESKWITPLFETQSQLRSTECNWAQKRNIISSILNTGDKPIVESVLDVVLRKMNSYGTGTGCQESTLLAVEAIKLATELKVEIKQVVNNDEKFFRGLIPRTLLHSWATSSRMQIRLACFSLLIETKKSLEIISAPDFESMKLVFKYNIVSQNPAFRQQFFAYYKRFIKRLRDSYSLLVRTKDQTNLENYNNFFKWLWHFLTEDEGLFPGANFGRRCQCLEFMSLLLEKFDVATLKIPLPSNHDVTYLQWIFDTYEYNKKLMFPILLKLYTRPLLQDINVGEKLLEVAFHLCESVHPPDSVTGTYLALFLVQHRCNNEAWIEIPELVAKIHKKLTSIKDAVNETSLIEVASKTQMYGYLRLLRSMFTKDFAASGDISKYRPFVVGILRLCLEINELLLPVLGDAAPEGFLPGLRDSDPRSSQIVRSISAQRLLVCSWRSMRDICMLLTELVTVFPVEGESVNYVWTFEEVREIGDHLLFLLKNVMHRGVFEQVFTGFKQLAYRLFKSTSGKLNDLPVKWLNDAFDEELISTKCYTRRSAGLPFIFQALLSPMCLNEPFIVKYVDRLLEQFGGATGESSYIRIHCTNVLRGLFKDANFSRVMMPYVPKGLKVVFELIKSSNWNESNSGLMLYGAIIRRTFGPELNLMTAPTFFRRFPEMYEFLLEQVKQCAKTVISDVESRRYRAADDFTYQVLLLLSSFAVSGVVEYGTLKISEFVQPIRTCASSRDYQVREIAAKALKPFLIKTTSKLELILSIVNEYKQSGVSKSANSIHGDLLQILHVLKSIPEVDSKDVLIEAFNNTFTPETSLWNLSCPTIFEALADICMFFGPPLRTVQANLQNFYATKFDPLRITDDGDTFPGLPNADAVIAQAQVQFLLYESNPEMVICDWIRCKPRTFLVQVFTALSSQRFLHGSSGTPLKPEALAVFDATIRRYLEEQTDFPGQTSEEESFLDFLSGVDGSVYGRWAQIAGSEKFCEELFKKVLQICQMEVGTTDCKSRATIVLGKLVFRGDIELTKGQKEVVCKIFSTFCDPSSDVDLRLAVAKAMSALPFTKINGFSVIQQAKIWYAILTLMLDDDGDVRGEINAKLGEDKDKIGDTEVLEGRELFCERKSCELIVLAFLTEFGQKHELEALILITGLILRDDYDVPVTGSDDFDEDHLFERSEMNAYAEPLLLAKILKENLAGMPQLRDVFRNHFQNSRLTPDLVSLYEFVANTQIPPTPSTLQDLVTTALAAYDKNVCDQSFITSFLEKSTVQRHILKFVASLLS